MLEKLYLNAGQMKAGTTFLYRLLQEHPDVHFSLEKEIHFLSQVYGKHRLLSDDIRVRKAKQLLQSIEKAKHGPARLRFLLRWVADYLERPENVQWYANLFCDARNGQYAADFSNLTCTIPYEGMCRVREAAETIRVTYCVREPVGRAFSHMKFHLRFAGETSKLADLSDHDLETLLLSDNIMPQSKTSQHIEVLVGAFGQENVRLIRCEEMWEKPQRTIDAICAFLGIGSISIDEELFRPINVGPKEVATTRVIGMIESVLADEIRQMRTCLNTYEHLVLG